MKEVKYLIIGAGISGLSTANELLAQGISKEDILVVEANDYIGGLIKTDTIDGYTTEWGPEGLRGNSEKTKRIFEMIDEEAIPVSEESKIRYIGKGDKIVKVPSGPLSAITTKLIPFSGKLRIFKEPFISKNEDDETIAAFVERRLGKHVVPLVDAFVTGVFGGDPYRLSIRHAFPSLKEIEIEYGNLIRGGMKHAKKKKQERKQSGVVEEKPKVKPPFLLTTESGMQGLVESLASNVNVELSHPVTKISLDEVITVETSNETIRCQQLVVATGINALQHIDIVDEGKKLDPPEILEAKVMVVSLGFDPDSFEREVRGYGFLIPDSENRFIMGTLFSSRLFEFRSPEDQLMLRCFVGGVRHPDRIELDNDQILKNVLSDLDDYLGLKKKPTFTHFQTHKPRGIPQLLLDHDKFTEWRSTVSERHPRVHFSGIGWKGISCDILIEESLEIADSIAQDTSEEIHTELAPQ